MKFNKEQIEFMKKIGISESLSDEIIEEKISTHLQEKGFDENYEPTEDGIMCESILDIL